MKFIFILPIVFASYSVQGKVIATYRYSKASKAVTKKLELEEAQRAYASVKRETFQPPSKQRFFDDFLRFKMGVEVAYHEPALVKGPQIENMITNPFLKAAFEQELYTALAELKLKAQMKALDKKAANLPKENPAFPVQQGSGVYL